MHVFDRSLTEAMQAFPSGRVTPGKSGTPPCKSGQLEKDLGLEASSLGHAARLIIFEITMKSEPSRRIALTAYVARSYPDPTHALWIGSDISPI